MEGSDAILRLTLILVGGIFGFLWGKDYGEIQERRKGN